MHAPPQQRTSVHRLFHHIKVLMLGLYSVNTHSQCQM
uniref:Uncharacterized protein n=1 Tax=Anguilla anguilla TaxID=7936 RepID=A0A0E9U0Z7_ANGAN